MYIKHNLCEQHMFIRICNFANYLTGIKWFSGRRESQSYFHINTCFGNKMPLDTLLNYRISYIWNHFRNICNYDFKLLFWSFPRQKNVVRAGDKSLLKKRLSKIGLFMTEIFNDLYAIYTCTRRSIHNMRSPTLKYTTTKIIWSQNTVLYDFRRIMLNCNNVEQYTSEHVPN